MMSTTDAIHPPQVLRSRFTNFLGRDLDVGLYPVGIRRGYPATIAYAKQFPENIWRPFVVPGDGDVPSHPAMREVQDFGDNCYAPACRDGGPTLFPEIRVVHELFREPPAAVVKEAHILFNDVKDIQALERRILRAGTTNEHQMLMYCVVLMGGRFLFTDEPLEDLWSGAYAWATSKGNVGRGLLSLAAEHVQTRSEEIILREQILASHLDDEVAESDAILLLARYEEAFADQLEPRFDPAIIFQGISLSLRKPETAHRAVPFLKRSLRWNERGADISRALVEDQLRLAWVLMATEPMQQEHWRDAAVYLQGAATLAFAANSLGASPEALARLDEFADDVKRTSCEQDFFHDVAPPCGGPLFIGASFLRLPK